ncbi:hypothetical protein MANI_008659 [Metarhizium anisopliae]|nr:hypothetical protein MANI_008659 [Metarhizium anisopliae]
MTPSISDSRDTEASLPSGEPNTNGDSPLPLLERIPLRVASEIWHNILSGIRYLQKLGHVPSDCEFCLTENFVICLESMKSKEEALGEATEQHGTWECRDDDIYFLGSLLDALSDRPRTCHCAFTRVENTIRDISHLAENSSTLNCRDLGELFLRTAHREYAKDIKTARSLLKEIDDDSFWEDKNVAEVAFPNVMARLLGCDPRTLEPANVFDEIGAMSPKMLSGILYIRSYNQLDSCCRGDDLDVVLAARVMERKLDTIDCGLQRAIGFYLRKSDDN